MHTLYIADDEAIVLDGLIMQIPWHDYNIQIVGSASDGITAYKEIVEIKPNLLLTDIRMPGMDGLELIEKVMQVLQDIRCIIFSGFSEFEYAKRAIRLEAFDYLVKPVETEEIIATVLKALDKQAQAKQSSLVAAEDILWEITTAIEVQYHVQEIRDFFIAGTSVEKSLSREKRREIKQACIQVCEPTGFKPYVVFNNQEIVVVLAAPTAREAEARNGIKKTVAALNEAFSALLDKKMHIGVGNYYAKWADAANSYSQAREAYDYSIYIDAPVSLYRSDYYRDGPPLILEHTLIIEHLLSGEGMETITGYLTQMGQKALNMKIKPSILKDACLEMIYKVLYYFEENCAIQTENILGEAFRPAVIENCQSAREIMQSTISIIQTATDYIAARKINYKNKLIDDIKLFIMENYSSDISLGQIAEYIHMSPTYVSNIFAKETGLPLFDFLSGIRIKEAQKLLRESNEKIYIIAKKVGYKDQRYFSQVFRKYTSQTAKEYRDSFLKPEK